MWGASWGIFTLPECSLRCHTSILNEIQKKYPFCQKKDIFYGKKPKFNRLPLTSRLAP